MADQTEHEMRDTLAQIDMLRADAKLCERMHTHWMGHDGELVEIAPVVVRRRWREERTTHSERVMTRAERGLFLEWLSERGRQVSAEAEALSATLTRKEPTDG